MTSNTTEDNRPSLVLNIEKRYTSQKVGGAFNAKDISTAAGTRSTNGGTGFGFNDTKFTNKNFLIKKKTGVSDFVNDGNNLSTYIQQHSNKRYKP
jgi:hypothetical protein